MEVTERKAAVPDLDALAQLVGGVRSPAWPDGLFSLSWLVQAWAHSLSQGKGGRS